MYIFKQPRIGAPVTPHQDSTFLRTTPRPTCLGLWLALQDATLDNGCLWARPGSHTEPVRRHFARQPPDGLGRVQMGFVPLLPEGEPPPPAAAWEGGLPPAVASPAEVGFVPLEATAGDLVLIHGQVDHLSLPNTSGVSRHTFQLHLVEGEAGGATWHPANWLQYPDGKAFPDLPLGPSAAPAVAELAATA
jgi:phytanoyl-CoA hydroxylase